MHGKVLSETYQSTSLVIPLFRSVQPNINISNIKTIPPLSAEMKQIPVPSSNIGTNGFMNWAMTESYKGECKNEHAPHRWNCIPIESFMSLRGREVSIVPLDLYEPLPALKGTQYSSVLAQIFCSEVFIVIRTHNVRTTSDYVEAIKNEILLMVEQSRKQ